MVLPLEITMASPTLTKVLSKAACTPKVVALPSSAEPTVPLLSASVVMLTSGAVPLFGAVLSIHIGCWATPHSP